MAVLSEHDFAVGSVNLWTFGAEEIEHGRLDRVRIDTGDEDADHILRQVPVEVWERIACSALAFQLVLARDRRTRAGFPASRPPP